MGGPAPSARGRQPGDCGSWWPARADGTRQIHVLTSRDDLAAELLLVQWQLPNYSCRN